MILTQAQRISPTQAAVYQLRLDLADRGCNFSPCVAAILDNAAKLPDLSTYAVPGL